MLLRRSMTLCVLGALTGIGLGCGNPPAAKESSAKTEIAQPATNAAQSAGEAKKAKLQIEDIVVGKGPLPKPGNKVTVHYIGKFPDGKEFNNSYKEKRPYTFVLGVGMVVPGWDEGLATMRAGGKRKLIVPPPLAYGEAGSPEGKIPPNTTLHFEIELLKVE